MIFWTIGFLTSISKFSVYLEYAAYFPNRSGGAVTYLEQVTFTPLPPNPPEHTLTIPGLPPPQMALPNRLRLPHSGPLLLLGQRRHFIQENKRVVDVNHVISQG